MAKKTKDQSKAIRLLITLVGNQFRKWRRIEKNEGSYNNERSYESYYSDRDQSYESRSKEQEEVQSSDNFRSNNDESRK